jgi:hypothetical protein
LFDVQVHDDGCVLPVRAAGRLGTPTGFDQAHERICGVGERRCLPGRILGPFAFGVVTVAVVAFPFGDLRVAMRLQGGVELRRLHPRQADPPGGVRLADGLADRALRLGLWIGVGSGFQLDRGAQLTDRGAGGQLRVVLIGSVGPVLGDDPDLIQGQPALPHARRATGELLESVGDGGDRGGVTRGDARLPGHQRRN